MRLLDSSHQIYVAKQVNKVLKSSHLASQFQEEIQKRELTGGLIFIILGFLYVFMMSKCPFIPFTNYVVMAGPLFLIGSSFLLDGFLKKGGD